MFLKLSCIYYPLLTFKMSFVRSLIKCFTRKRLEEDESRLMPGEALFLFLLLHRHSTQKNSHRITFLPLFLVSVTLLYFLDDIFLRWCSDDNTFEHFDWIIIKSNAGNHRYQYCLLFFCSSFVRRQKTGRFSKEFSNSCNNNNKGNTHTYKNYFI